MRIPSGKLAGFVREITKQCFQSRQDRIQRGIFFETYFASGSNDSSNPALFNKIYESIDDLESLLYSPTSLRFRIGDLDNPSPLSIAKGRAAASRMRNYARSSNTDTMISDALRAALIKGKSFIKQSWRKDDFAPGLVQSEDLGVLRENVTHMNEEMEAFSHKMLITPYELDRLLTGRRDKAALMKSLKNYMRQGTGVDEQKKAAMQITVGGMYPFQPANGGNGPTARGLVDWLSQPKPNLAPGVEGTLLELDETWIWDDEREDWATFQMIGETAMIMGEDQIINAFAYDTGTLQSAPSLKGAHPYTEFCVNPMDTYFWGRSELSHLVGLQECINSRLAGMNKLLRKQENPTKRFTGVAGVNQETLSRYAKPGGYWVDLNPQAKIETDQVTIPQDFAVMLHEYERMFDAVMGLPPVARGKGDSGVRSASHANTLVRQFSPRFKDRALLVERNVEALGGLMLDMARAHSERKLTAWVPAPMAGAEAMKPDPLNPPPAEGLVAVLFRYGDLPEDATLQVDSHSASPAFEHENKALHFDLLKVGAEDTSELVEHVDVQNPEELHAGIMRREAAAAKAKEQEEQIRLATGHGGAKKH